MLSCRGQNTRASIETLKLHFFIIKVKWTDLKEDALIVIIHLITILKFRNNFLCSHFLTALTSCRLQKKHASYNNWGLEDNHMSHKLRDNPAMILQHAMLEWYLMSIKIPMNYSLINYVCKLLTMTLQECFLMTENSDSCLPSLKVFWTLLSRLFLALTVVHRLCPSGSECLKVLLRVLWETCF